MNEKGILDENHNVVVVKDVMEWAKAFEVDKKRVAEDQIGDTRISTVFLGLNHSFGDGPPMWFETMVFGGPSDQAQERYSTWSEACDGHDAMVSAVRTRQESLGIS